LFGNQFKYFGDYKEWKQNVPRPISDLSLLEEFPTRFFDGASEHGLCGGGMWLQLENIHDFLLWMGCGVGSNTKA